MMVDTLIAANVRENVVVLLHIKITFDDFKAFCVIDLTCFYVIKFYYTVYFQ